MCHEYIGREWLLERRSRINRKRERERVNANAGVRLGVGPALTFPHIEQIAHAVELALKNDAYALRSE